MKKPEFLKKVFLALIIICLFISAANAAQKVSFSDNVVTLTPKNPKIASSVYQAINFAKSLSPEEKKAYTSLKKSPVKLENFPCRLSDDGKIQVYIYLNQSDDDTIKKLKGSGIDVQLKSESRNLIQANVSIEKIEKISSLSAINLITLPSYAVHFAGATYPKSITPTHLDTDRAVKDFKIPTSNVRIGVLSDGVAGEDISREIGDVKTSNTLQSSSQSFVEGDNPSNVYNGNEGLAIIEILTDIAPAAKFHFAAFSTDIEMVNAKNWLAGKDVPGDHVKLFPPCDVIVDDVGFFAAGPLTGESDVSRASGIIVSEGTPYYTSVGNLAEFHYMADFNDKMKPNGIHEFNYDTSTLKADETLECRNNSSSVARILLQWDQDDPAGPWTTVHDLDLYILDPKTLDFNNPIAVSNVVQNGATPPYEFIALAQSVDCAIVVRKKNPSDTFAKRFHLFLYPMSELEYSVPYGSIINNNDAKCISVGAIDVNHKTRDRVEDFSSRGPTDDGRTKPEICSYDGVMTSTPGFMPFFGTSAASPHAAGLAALMLAINPELSPEQINNRMFSSATDLYIPGDIDYVEGGEYDVISGFGRMEGYTTLRKLYYDSLKTGVLPDVRYANYPFNNQGAALYDTDTKWIPQTTPYFAPPDMSYSNGELMLKARNNTNCYGSWISSLVKFANTQSGDSDTELKPGKIYEASFYIRTNADTEVFPSFRIRMGTKDNVYSVTKVINSLTANEVYPGWTGREYSIQMVPPAASLSSGLYLAVDILNFDTKDKSDAALYINEVTVVEKDYTTP